MRFFKIISLMLFAVILNGCTEYGEKRIVKLITIDKDNIAVYYYDYSQEKTAYLKEERENNGIENTIVQLLSENQYDLKLCKYAVCDKETVTDGISSVYKGLMHSKFSPDIVIIAGDTSADYEKYIEMEDKNYPVYTCFSKDNLITGVVETADSTDKNIIIDSVLYKTLEREQSFVFDILNNNVNKGIYSFLKDGNNLSANLEQLSAYYYVKDGVLNICISAELKSYKGMPSDEKNKQLFIKLLEDSIKLNAKELIEDKKLAENLNLLWYRNIEDFNTVNIEADIR